MLGGAQRGFVSIIVPNQRKLHLSKKLQVPKQEKGKCSDRTAQEKEAPTRQYSLQVGMGEIEKKLTDGSIKFNVSFTRSRMTCLVTRVFKWALIYRYPGYFDLFSNMEITTSCIAG